MAERITGKAVRIKHQSWPDITTRQSRRFEERQAAKAERSRQKAEARKGVRHD